MLKKVIESDTIKKLLILLLIGLIASLTISNVMAAESITITSKPSAGGTGLSYKWTTNTWKNYCPLCNRHGGLLINPKGVYEKELTCKYCGADYCGSSGKDKANRCRATLSKIKYKSMVINTPVWNIQKTPNVLDQCQTLVKSYIKKPVKIQVN